MHLIDDLIPHILESEDNWWVKDLLRLALVSPSWLRYVRNRLYRCPVLRSFNKVTLLARTLSATPSLLQLVHGLDICPRDHAMDEEDMGNLILILDLDILRSVRFGGEMTFATERFLEIVTHAESITQLYIDGERGADGAPFERRSSLKWDASLVHRFRNLKVLRLSNIDLDIKEPMSHVFRVTDLVLDNVYIANGFLPHLFHSSSLSLRTLSIQNGSEADTNAQIESMLDCCSARLESLHFDAGDVATRSPESVLCTNHLGGPPRKYPALRRLCLSGAGVDTATVASIAHCCENLEELSITGRLVRVTPSEWVSILSSHAFPRLKRLYTPWDMNSQRSPPWPQCEANAVLRVGHLQTICLINSDRCVR
jgi:hypothetical protein